MEKVRNASQPVPTLREAAPLRNGSDNGYEITVFADGRGIIKGTRDPAVARSLYARYIGA